MSDASRALIIEIDPYFEKQMINNLQMLDSSNGMKGKIIRAMYRAGKRATSGAQTLASKYSTKRYYISARDFKSNLKFTNPKGTDTPDGVTFEVKFRGASIPLVNFGYKIGYNENGREMIKTKIMKGGSWVYNKRRFTVDKHGRIQTMYRTTENNYPIEEQWGPTTASMIYSDEVKDPMLEKFENTYHERLMHELDRVLLFTGLT